MVSHKFSQILGLADARDYINVKTTPAHVKIVNKLVAAMNYFLINMFLV